MTVLQNLPQGCGCAACQKVNASELSSSYTGSSTPTLAEANTLYAGQRWGSGSGVTTVTYKFFSSLPSYYSWGNQESYGFQAFNSQMKAATVKILGMIESFTNIDFVETTGATTQVGFAQTVLPSNVGAWAYYPDTTQQFAGDVWTNRLIPQTQNPVEGNYGFYTLMHEIGHAIGLKHSFEAGLSGDENSSRYTVMAYDWSPFFSSSYMVYDIAALQKVYGANMSYHTGSDVYITNATQAYTIWDAGGTDRLDASAQTAAVTLDLREGMYSSVGMTRNIGIAFGAVIENATGGAGNDTLIGNAANNVLIGNNGNDTFVASKGKDTVYGGSGTDSLIFDDALSNFYVAKVNSTTLSLMDTSGLYGTTLSSSVEVYEFANTKYSFTDLVNLAAAVGAYADDVPDVGFTVQSTYLSGTKMATGLTNILSTTEGVKDVLGTDIKCTFKESAFSMLRSNNSGDDTLILTANSKYVSSITDIQVKNVGSLDAIFLNGFNKVTLVDTAVTHDMTIKTSGGVTLDLRTGSGHDLIDVTGRADSGTTTTTIYTNAGNDTVVLNEYAGKIIANVYTGDGNDKVTGNMNSAYTAYAGNGDDILIGGKGADKLYGDAGNDTLRGGDAADTLVGGYGNDILYGDAGNDILTGGVGLDKFVVTSALASSRDTITDFNAKEDIIDISSILVGYDPVHEAISDFVKIASTTSGMSLQVDVDGKDNGVNFTTVLIASGLTGQSVDALVASHHLQVIA